MPPPVRAAETVARLRKRFAPARLHVAAAAVEAEHLAALAARATWYLSSSSAHSAGRSDGRSLVAASDAPMLLGRWPLVLHAHLLLVRWL